MTWLYDFMAGPLNTVASIYILLPCVFVGGMYFTIGTGAVARHGGSNGAISDPSRVWKGKKMAGHLGAEKVTVQNLIVVKVDAENNLIAVKGAIPGPNGGTVVLRDSVKA